MSVGFRTKGHGPKRKVFLFNEQKSLLRTSPVIKGELVPVDINSRPVPPAISQKQIELLILLERTRLVASGRHTKGARAEPEALSKLMQEVRRIASQTNSEVGALQIALVIRNLRLREIELSEWDKGMVETIYQQLTDSEKSALARDGGEAEASHLAQRIYLGLTQIATPENPVSERIMAGEAAIVIRGLMQKYRSPAERQARHRTRERNADDGILSSE